MFHYDKANRRQHRRYVIPGKATLCHANGQVEGEILDIGRGGLLVCTNAKLDPQVFLEVRFTLEDYPYEIRNNGKVARTDIGVVGIIFTEETPSLKKALLWLEARFVSSLLLAL